MERMRTAGVTVVQPGEGDYGEVDGVGVVFKLFGEQTNGNVSIVEHPLAVGAFVDPHVHTREDEYSIVTEGEIGFRSGDREVVLGRGGYITKPRGQTHMMWNAGQTPARMIEVISPAGLEHFFWAIRDLVADGPPDPETLQTLAAEHGIEFTMPPWFGDVLARYHLSSPQPEG
jgi:mannose-6-phosphate isomerase-like protein (cupin superfamily)